MKRKMFFLIVITFVFCIEGEINKNCLKNTKLKVDDLKQKKYKKYTNAKRAKAKVKEIVNRLKKCGLSEIDLQPFQKYQKEVVLDIEKHVRKRKDLPMAFTAFKLKKMISELEQKYSETSIEQKAIIPEKKEIKKELPTEIEKEKRESEEIIPKPKVDSSFPPEDFTVSKGDIYEEKAFIITANELKTKLELMEKKYQILSETIDFYYIGFLFSSIAVIVIFVLLVILSIYMRNTQKRIAHLNHKINKQDRY